MGIFEFVIVLVLIATAGEVIKARVGRPSPSVSPAPDTQHLEETIDHLSRRVLRLEEERDFYRALLEPGEEAPPTESRPPLPGQPREGPDQRD